MLSSEMFLPKTLLSDQALARRQNFKTDFYVCIHEAGHVVATRYFGFQVAWVSYDTDFLQNDRLAIANNCASGDPVTMTIALSILTPILKRGFAASQGECEIIRGYCIQVLAGPAAEIAHNPDAPKRRSGETFGRRELSSSGSTATVFKHDASKSAFGMMP